MPYLLRAFHQVPGRASPGFLWHASASLFSHLQTGDVRLDRQPHLQKVVFVKHRENTTEVRNPENSGMQS